MKKTNFQVMCGTFFDFWLLVEKNNTSNFNISFQTRRQAKNLDYEIWLFTNTFYQKHCNLRSQDGNGVVQVPVSMHREKLGPIGL